MLDHDLIRLLRWRFCERKFESVTPTSRMPFGGGKTDRIRSRATSYNLSLVAIAVSIDRLRVEIWKSAHLIFTVTVRPRECVFSHHLQTSSAISITPASIPAGSVRSSGKVLSDPDDFRSRSGRTGRSSRPREIS